MLQPSSRRYSLALLLAFLIPLFAPLSSSLAQRTPPPETVTIPGTIQSALGCPGDWQPECEKTFLTYDPEDDLWQGEFDLPAGSYEYKVALNKSWGENYGLNARRDGPNIPLVLATPARVKFYYDHKTNWVTDNINTPIAVLVGDFQTKLGCLQDYDPACLRSWLQDPEGSGVLSLVTSNIPAGAYEVRVAMNENNAEIYGIEGAQDGEPFQFEVPLRVFTYFGFDPTTKDLVISTEGPPRGDLKKHRAYWVARDTILWSVAGAPENVYALHYAAEGGIRLEPGRITGGEELQLIYTPGGPPPEIANKFPHLAKLNVYRLRPEDVDKAPSLLKGQVAVSARDAAGRLLDATSLQIPGVLDDLYAYSGALGISFEAGAPVLRLWGPTAREVKLHLFPDSSSGEPSSIVAMQFDPASGVWSAVGTSDWKGLYYLYAVDVYVHSLGRVTTNLVTDPYSLSLSMNSARSQIIDLDDPALQPAGWSEPSKPPLEAPEDIVLYELHVRDFSALDESVPSEMRGTFKAFTLFDSHGMRHLKSLAEAGLTHVHLLPAFDIATINEDKSQWREPDPVELASFPPDSSAQQEAVGSTRGEDGYNWGYDPYHFNAPEGSYATQPDGPERILEFRQMVQALNSIGLRVVMDVVYNHTNSSGQDPRSVLDKVVPGYYHRLNADGLIETSTCCQNTASEHLMMEKLMVDSLLLWATAYKVDGFRFDLMGHHMLSNMQNARAALDGLTLQTHGVDGKSIYIYGEGWNFGEVANNARGVNATQTNIGGTGIGAFNDRLRDGVRGGGPFSGLQEQGFITGLFDQPNATSQGSLEEQHIRLLRHTDWIRIGLAGNLRDYELQDFIGRRVTGVDIDYKGSPAGYALDPQETINYVSAHDNETLFDAIQLKAAPDLPVAERARMQNLGLSLVLLGQGIPFIHAGDEILRSKSLDRNSYDSGDWFNRLDFTYQTNNFGVGLPPAWDNAGNWPLMAPLLADTALKPGSQDILASLDNFKELLQIRRSSPLFRLRTAQQIQERVSFSNTGAQQVPGVIVMRLSDIPGEDLDPNYALIVVVFNATHEQVEMVERDLAGLSLELHPVQAVSKDSRVRLANFDPSSGGLIVPGRTTAVFVSTLPAPERPELVPTETTTPPEPVPSPEVETPTVLEKPVTPTPKSEGMPHESEVPETTPGGTGASMSTLSVVLVGLVILLCGLYLASKFGAKIE